MIYLASASPRRQELLRQIGIRFEVLVPGLVEAPDAVEPPLDYVTRVARAKARRGVALMRERNLPIRPVLGADTEVVLDDEILGKPVDRGHGLAMLRRLSGRTHRVLTAISLVQQDEMYEAVSESRVTFAPLAEIEVERYWDTGEPADKAGGYGIQGAAAVFIQRLDGSYSGVVGLPLFELAQLLKHAGVATFERGG
jgi:septum formation protein